MKSISPLSLLLILTLFLLGSCSVFQTSRSAKPPLPPLPDTPQYRTARTFDLFVKGELSKKEKQALIKECKKRPGANIFCFSILRSKILERKAQAKRKAKLPKFKEPPKPIPPKLVKGKITNWSRLRPPPDLGISEEPAAQARGRALNPLDLPRRRRTTTKEGRVLCRAHGDLGTEMPRPHGPPPPNQ